jgi:hypothetical protein
LISSYKEQPQVITSPDGKIQIMNHHSYSDRFGCYYTEGVIKYVSPEPGLCAEITVDYYDSDRKPIDSEVIVIDFFEPGITRAFYILYSGLRRAEVQHYNLYITAKNDS